MVKLKEEEKLNENKEEKYNENEDEKSHENLKTKSESKKLGKFLNKNQPIKSKNILILK
jgi:hypothetical protein